jgi:hypothetical protein
MPSFFPVRHRSAFDLSTTLFVASLLCMFLAEAFIIRGLWFRTAPILHRTRGFDLPFLIWIPAFGAFLFLLLIRKQTREGRISPAIASGLSTGLALLSLTAYLLITRCAQIAFR